MIHWVVQSRRKVSSDSRHKMRWFNVEPIARYDTQEEAEKFFGEREGYEFRAHLLTSYRARLHGFIRL